MPQAGLPPLPASTTWAALDRDGNAVVCSVSLDNLFGTGRIVPGLGFLLAASPASVPPPLYAAALAWNDHLNAFRAEVGGSGQAAAPMAVAVGMLNTLTTGAGDGGAGARSRARQRHRLRELPAGCRPAAAAGRPIRAAAAWRWAATDAGLRMTLKVGRGAAAPPFMVMDVIAAANARAAALPPGAPHVIRMEVGQPGTGAPAGAVAAAVAALRSGDALGYTEAFGRRSLRERIVAHYRDWYGLDVPVERVAVTVGASGAFPLAFLAAFDPGDRVALAAPFYPPYVNILTALGMQPVVLEAGPETRFQPSVALLEALDPPPDGLIVASPCNPAGTMLHPGGTGGDRALVRRARRAADQRRDLPWAALRQRRSPSAASFSGNAVVVNSFSKYFSMTGWRVGWLLLPEDLVRPVECLAQNLFISAPHLSQIVAEAAFDCGAELEANVARYRRSRDHLLRALPEAGFSRLSPAEGAFYLFADIADRSNDSEAFCARMLAEAGVAASPGVDFDRTRGRRFLRFSYCGPEADMREAAARLKAWR